MARRQPCSHTGKQGPRQTVRETGRASKQTERVAGSHTEMQNARYTYRQAVRHTGKQTNIHTQTSRQTEIDRHIPTYTDR